MKKPSYAIILILIIAGSFLVGRWSGKNSGRAGAGARKVLYYVDPMHPAYKSDKPGIAPDCGMQLEPVYVESPSEGADRNGSSPMPPGTLQIGPERQQVIGVRVGQVEQSSGTRILRTLGRVAPDETRVFRMATPVDGWVRSVGPVVTGTIVRQDEVLATFYNRDFLTAQQTYLYALNTMDRFKEGKEGEEQLKLTGAQMRAAEENLEFLGMGETQLKEIARTRKIARSIELRAPVAGVVLARNAFLGLRFERNTELFRVADLSHIWVLADVFENEAQYFKPGMIAHVIVPRPKAVFEAHVTHSVPQFDSSSRTIKVRLETENPGFVLRPDTFVDVELPIKLPPGLSIPADAVIDSGLHRRVYVDRGNGFFEPREIEIGWREGDRVQVVKGLMPGERVVVSGNFLVDSESRLKLAAAGLPDDRVVDPVCGMGVDARKAQGKKTDYKSQTYYFCSDLCKGKFDRNPEQYVGQGPGVGGPGSGGGARAKRAKDLACGMDVDITALGVIKAQYQGKTFYFCSPKCRDDFMKAPAKYLKGLPAGDEGSQSSAPRPEVGGQGSEFQKMEMGFLHLAADISALRPDSQFLAPRT